MTRSIALATLIAATVAACARPPAPPPPSEAAQAYALSSFVPYCGPIWLVGKQGYVEIPCPPGSNYPGAGR